jgi:hypothetical protein
MGPFSNREGAVNMGEACHIFSASVNGPRGRGGKDDKFIASENNGIWCCSYHAKLIDKSNGVDYPANVLFAWKNLSEARTQKQMNDIPSPLGWVESIKFAEFPLFSNPPAVIPSRLTLLWGRNGSGKSSLMEIAASITNSKYAERFVGTRKKLPDGSYESARFHAEVSYSTVDTLSKNICLEIKGERITRCEGLVRTLLPPGDLEVVFGSSRECNREHDEDDIDLFTRVLNIDKVALFSLVDAGGQSIFPGEMRFERAQEYDEERDKYLLKRKPNGDPYFELQLKPAGRNFNISYDSLSGSEKDRLFLDFLVRKAREICKQRLTLLLIDGLSASFDSGNFENLLRNLSNEDFQVLVSIAAAQEESILDFKDGTPSLKPLDYLAPWRLSTLPNPFE